MFQKNFSLNRLLFQLIPSLFCLNSEIFFYFNLYQRICWYCHKKKKQNRKQTPSACGIFATCPESNSHHPWLHLHWGLNSVPFSNWLIISVISIPTPFIWYQSTHGSLFSGSTRLWIASWLLNKLCQAIKSCVTGLSWRLSL